MKIRTAKKILKSSNVRIITHPANGKPVLIVPLPFRHSFKQIISANTRLRKCKDIKL